MTSVLKVSNIQNPSGTSAISIDSSGKVSFPNTVPELDIWHQTSSTAFSSGNAGLTTKWSRYANNWEKLGTGVSESSGVFTFPSTGKWKVSFIIDYQTSGNASYLGGYITLSTDGGSTYANITEGFGAADHSGAYEHVHLKAYIDVTDTSNFKILFKKDNDGNATLRGSSTKLLTHVSFEKLAET